MAPAIPLAERVPDLFAPERAAKGAIVADIGIMLADGNDDIQPADRLDPAPVGQIGHIMAGGMLIDIVIVIPTKKPAHIIFTAERQHAAKELRVAQRNVHGVVRAKATAMRNQERVAVLAANQR